MMNEAELTSKVIEILTKIFPTFKTISLDQQRTFSIKFGHHNITIDGRDPSKYASRAIFDVLLNVGETNCILLELKKDGHTISQEDIDQGISYARLIHPMPPITLLSNGKENLFFNTLTKLELDITDVDFTYIKNLIENSLELAANDLKDAISLLLNKDPKVFSSVINAISEERFGNLLGPASDFTMPISTDFMVQREIVDVISEVFLKKETLVGIVGPGYSGKTNVLYQFFEMSKSVENQFLLYIDCNDHNYSILQQLANKFSSSFKSSVTPEKIREWLITATNTGPSLKFFLLLDNFSDEIPDHIKSEIIEIIDIFKNSNNGILFTLDELHYKSVAYVKNRPYKTLIGRESKILLLKDLNDDEYRIATQLIFNNFRAVVELGGHYADEYRKPRILRILACLYDFKDGDQRKYTKIPAVPDSGFLITLASNKSITYEINEYYKKIALCFIEENPERKKNPELQIAAFASGCISYEYFQKKFPSDLDGLLKSGTVVIRIFEDGRKVIFPKLPELIAYHSINIIASMLITFAKERTEKEITDYFLAIVSPFPYADILGAEIILKIGTPENAQLFSDLILNLQSISPSSNEISPGTVAQTYIENVGHITMNFPDGYHDDGFTQDPIPFMILSQLADRPMQSQVGEDGPISYDHHLELIKIIGSSPISLIRINATAFESMKPLHCHDFDGVGSIICSTEGIIEPIVQSIVKCFYKIPVEMEKLYESAFYDNNFPLVWRFYLALRTLTEAVDDEIAKKAKTFMDKFNSYFRQFMNDFLTKDISDSDEKQRIKDLLAGCKKD